jgi:membrane fusion protein (multidrug efflux system)
MGRRETFWSAIGALVLLAFGGWFFMDYLSLSTISSPSKPAAGAVATTRNQQSSAAIAVETTRVAVDTVLDEMRAVGTLTANESIVVSAEIAGRISRIGFAEGQKVKAGDVLLELDDTVLKAELDKVRSDLSLARANRERASTLASQGAGTQRARDETEAAFLAQQANLALAEARLQKSTLTAPFSGVVGLRNVSVGAYIVPGQRIAELADISTLKVDFRVPEINATQVRVGNTIVVTADAIPGATFEGNVYAIDPIVDVNGRAMRLRAQVPNPDGRLLPGFFARVRIIIDQRPNALLVPESAIIPLDGKMLVYRVVDGRAVRAEVELGQRIPGQVEIRKGLSASDTVVTSGHQRLREGAAIQVVGSAPRGGATAGPTL